MKVCEIPAGGDLSRDLAAALETGTGKMVLGSGRHELSAPLRFGATHRDFTVTAAEPGTAILDGGRRITEWQETTLRGIRAWVADLAEVRAGLWNFRQLFVNDRRAPRARFPKFGTSPDARDNLLEMDEIRIPDRTNKMTGGDVQFRPKSGDIGDWPSLYDAEIVVPHFWLDERMTQPRLNPATGWIESARRSAFVLTAAFGPELARYYVDNLFEALTDPGEWYLDRAQGRLWYLPLPDESLETTEVFAPRLLSLLEIRGSGFNQTKQYGDPCMDEPAGRGIIFEGLVFRHADWIQPNPSFAVHDKVPPPERPLAACGQSACDAPAALNLGVARDTVFRNCRVEHVGGYALSIGHGCRRIEVTGCTFHDLGAGGIRLNGAERDGPAWRVTGYCSLTDNTIHAGGRVFHAGVGVLAMNTLENVIAHNHIHDLFYSGVSVGWSWGYKDTISRDNLILHNLVHDVGQGLLSDLGAIYILGVQPGTIVAGNHVHSVAKRRYGSIGIYLDEGASHIVVENNTVHDIQGACANVHFGRENIIRRNTFMVAPSHVGLTIGKSEAHLAATVLQNIFFVPAGAAAFGGGYSGDPRRSFDSLVNTFYTGAPDGPGLWDDGYGEYPFTWDSWLAAGKETGSTVHPLAEAPKSTPAAGPRPELQRPILRQPLTREDRPPA